MKKKRFSKEQGKVDLSPGGKATKILHFDKIVNSLGAGCIGHSN
ncbi:MAG: hypothetical protein VCF07_16050 [Nitrospinota bacterium]